VCVHLMAFHSDGKFQLGMGRPCADPSPVERWEVAHLPEREYLDDEVGVPRKTAASRDSIPPFVFSD
jgi:hypothetical protein